MTLKYLLKGGRMAHPLHPALVHLPIGLWVASLFFDLMTLLAGDTATSATLVQTSYYCILLGIVFAAPAASTRLAEYADIARGSRPRVLATTHLYLNVLVILGYILQLALRDLRLTRVEGGMFAFNVALVLVLGISGYIGGRLAYEFGVGRRPSETERKPSSFRRVA